MRRARVHESVDGIDSARARVRFTFPRDSGSRYSLSNSQSLPDLCLCKRNSGFSPFLRHRHRGVRLVYLSGQQRALHAAKGKASGRRLVPLNAKARSMLQDIKKILYHESTILSRLDELASEITEDYRGRDLTVVAVLNGSLVFMADLLRRIPIHLQLDCLSVASYHGTRSAGQISFRKGQFHDVRDRHVLILDDILDTGA